MMMQHTLNSGRPLHSVIPSCGAQMELLLQENNRLKKQLQNLMKQRDNFENTFKTKLEKIRSKSKSKKKLQENKQNIRGMVKQKENKGVIMEQKQKKIVQNKVLQNNNYLSSQTSINLHNKCATVENEHITKQINRQVQVQVVGFHLLPKNNIHAQIHTQDHRIICKRVSARQNSELAGPQNKKRAVYEVQNSQKRIPRHFHRSTEPIQSSRNWPKLRNTVYTQD